MKVCQEFQSYSFLGPSEFLATYSHTALSAVQIFNFEKKNEQDHAAGLVDQSESTHLAAFPSESVGKAS